MLEAIVDQQAAWFHEQRRSWQRMLSIPRVFELAMDTRVGSTPHEVVFQDGALRLLRYRRETPARYAEPVLFCYALINRHYILDLQSDKSVVRQYIERGFDVYLIDWGVPTDDDRHLKIEHYVCERLAKMVDFVLRAHGREDLHLLGYCMGGTIGAMFTSLHPDRVKSLTLLAAPVDFSGQETLLNLWTDRKYFDVDAFIDTHGNCPAVFLQTCFLMMKPVQNLVEKHIAFYEQLDDPRFVANYLAMECWVNDNIPVAGETFREFVKSFYQSNDLIAGRYCIRQRPVELGRITCPLLVLTANKDHLVAPTSTESIRAHVGSRDVEMMRIEAGHVGLVVGGKAHKTFWPRATEWLGARSTKPLVAGEGPI
jgi:polyhydroxyalkanoate synthase